MKKQITAGDFFEIIKGTIFEENYGMILNTLSLYEHTTAIDYREKKTPLDIQMANECKAVGDKIFNFLYSNGYYEID